MSRLAASSAVGLASKNEQRTIRCLPAPVLSRRPSDAVSIAVAYDVLDKRSQLDLADVAAGAEGLESVGRLAHLESIVHWGDSLLR